jgi:hypothetical protein
MKTAKLSIGIISIVLSVFVIFQSCAAGISNSLSSNGESSGMAGLLVAITLMVGGIIGLATRKSHGRGGSLTSAGFYLFGALVGVLMAGSYKDLYVWAFIAWAFGNVYLIDGVYDATGSDELPKWYQKSWLITMVMIVFPPAGIALVWLSKKILLAGRIVATVICVLAFLLMFAHPDDTAVQGSADSAASSTQTEGQTSNQAVQPTAAASEKVYGLGETWTVDGQFSLIFTAAALTDDRNQFEDSNPAQVAILTYDYENIGVESDIMDLYISSSDFKVIDGGGIVASTYPASTVYPQETPVGAKCVGAQEAYGLQTSSSEIMVQYEATFKLPVQ